eukprot:566210_1
MLARNKLVSPCLSYLHIKSLQLCRHGKQLKQIIMITFFLIAIYLICVDISSSREYTIAPKSWTGGLTILIEACDGLAGDYVPARIESLEQNEAAWNACADLGGYYCLFDIVRDDTSKNEWYYYLDGGYDSNNPISYFNWAQAQPDNENCVAFTDAENKWHDIPCAGVVSKAVLCMPASELGTHTIDPTNIPSKTPTAITYHPTIPPTNNPIISDHLIGVTVRTTTKEDVTDYAEENIGLLLYILWGTGCFFILVLIVFLVWYCKNRTNDKEQKSKKEDDNKHKISQELGNTISISTVPTAPVMMRSVSLESSQREDSLEAMDRIEVIEWLSNEVHLGQYSSIFHTHGFESMRIVAAISSVDELREVGIVNEAHLTLLITEIRKLKLRRNDTLSHASHVYGHSFMDRVNMANSMQKSEHNVGGVLQEVDQEKFAENENELDDDMDVADDILLQEVADQMFTPYDDGAEEPQKEIGTTTRDIIIVDDESGDTDVDDIDIDAPLEGNEQSDATFM